MRKQQQLGFSLVETIIVLALIIVIATFSIIGFRNFARFQQYNQAVNDTVVLLYQTRLSARSAEENSNHGVKFLISSTTRFIGDTYDAADPMNEVAVYNSVWFETNLTGGVDEIVFNKLTGLPTATGTIVVHGKNYNASTTIEVTNAGVVQ